MNRGAGLQSSGRPPRRLLRTQISLILFREWRVLENPTDLDVCPTISTALPTLGKLSGIGLQPVVSERRSPGTGRIAATENRARTSALTAIGLCLCASIGHQSVRAFASSVR